VAGAWRRVEYQSGMTPGSEPSRPPLSSWRGLIRTPPSVSSWPRRPGRRRRRDHLQLGDCLVGRGEIVEPTHVRMVPKPDGTYKSAFLIVE
jgi:hypothetical protein